MFGLERAIIFTSSTVGKTSELLMEFFDRQLLPSWILFTVTIVLIQVQIILVDILWRIHTIIPRILKFSVLLNNHLHPLPVLPLLRLGGPLFLQVEVLLPLVQI